MIILNLSFKVSLSVNEEPLAGVFLEMLSYYKLSIVRADDFSKEVISYN